MSAPWPVALNATEAGKRLAVRFDTGETFEIAASLLRRRSPSAEGRGHGPAAVERADIYQGVRIQRMAPVGRYAVRIEFDDGHDSGLFTWAILYELGRALTPP